MYRIACLRIPRFPIVVHQKRDDLKGKPFVLLAINTDLKDANIGRCKIVLCSPEASKADVCAAMTFTEARAICSQLTWRKYDDKLYKNAQKKLASELIALSPRVSCGEPGIFFLDAEGLGRLGGEGKLCRDLLRLASRHGFVDGRVGVASSAFAARVASATSKGRWHIVPSGRDAHFLAPLSIDILPLSESTRTNLLALGVRTIKQMVALPRSSYIGRFEADLLNAYDLALGLDPTCPTLPSEERVFQCTMDIGSSMESLKETLFVLKSMLERLTSDLRQNGFVADELTARFSNNDELFDERLIKLLRSSSNSKFLLDVLRLSLESRPLIREYTAVQIIATRFSKESFEQLAVKVGQKEVVEDKFTESESITLLMQRLTTRLGENVLVRPLANDQYLPETAGLWQPVFGATRSPLVVDYNYVDQYLGSNAPRKDSLMPGLVLKRHVPAMPVFVQLTEDGSGIEPMPDAITYKGNWYHVSRITVPERISGMWWETPVRKSYYVALIERRESFIAGRSLDEFRKQQRKVKTILPAYMTVLLVYDHEERSWLVEGVFD